MAISCKHLWDDHVEQKGAFIIEQAGQRKAGFTGYLPKEAVKNRLQTLISLGVPNTFLIIAVRESIGELIHMTFPEMKAEWEKLANEVLPTSLQFFI